MDENYIKMARSADEIQELWEPKIGDEVSFHDDNEVFFIDDLNETDEDDNGVYKAIAIHSFHDNSCYLINKEEIKNEIYYYPTQEDLQEIAKKQLDIHISMELFEIFMKWLFSFECVTYGCKPEPDYFYNDGWKSYLSITEAWTYFVMETCFNKRWDSLKSEWVPL